MKWCAIHSSNEGCCYTASHPKITVLCVSLALSLYIYVSVKRMHSKSDCNKVYQNRAVFSLSILLSHSGFRIWWISFEYVGTSAIIGITRTIRRREGEGKPFDENACSALGQWPSFKHNIFFVVKCAKTSMRWPNNQTNFLSVWIWCHCLSPKCVHCQLPVVANIIDAFSKFCMGNIVSSLLKKSMTTKNTNH